MAASPKRKRPLKTSRLGPRFEDGSYGTLGGDVFDPDTGRVRKPIKVRTVAVPAKAVKKRKK